MGSRVRSTRKKLEVFKWTKCMEDFVHGQLGVKGDSRGSNSRCQKRTATLPQLRVYCQPRASPAVLREASDCVPTALRDQPRAGITGTISWAEYSPAMCTRQVWHSAIPRKNAPNAVSDYGHAAANTPIAGNLVHKTSMRN